jgi:endonuclease/exonuclease/phosphatase family metal-dependent hydrolase
VLTVEGDLQHQLLSLECPPPDDVEPADLRPSEERTNGILIASRLPLEWDTLPVPCLEGEPDDSQFAGNTLPARIPACGLRVLGVRVEYIVTERAERVGAYWTWLENAAAVLLRTPPAVILGDLNTPPVTGRERSGVRACFRRIIESGWRRVPPTGNGSYFNHQHGTWTEIDHILYTPQCRLREAEYVVGVAGFTLAGTPDALSDHAAVVADLDIPEAGGQTGQA